MTNRRSRFGAHRAKPAGSLLAVSMCLAVGLLLVSTGAALGISAFATPGPAVRAQYPDSTGSLGGGSPPVVSNLASLMRLTREAHRDPKAAARLRVEERQAAQKATHAVMTAGGMDARQSGSIALLIVGLGVLSVGGVLRWRRGLAEI
jgi:hypothetical protein